MGIVVLEVCNTSLLRSTNVRDPCSITFSLYLTIVSASCPVSSPSDIIFKCACPPPMK